MGTIHKIAVKALIYILIRVSDFLKQITSFNISIVVMGIGDFCALAKQGIALTSTKKDRLRSLNLYSALRDQVRCGGEHERSALCKQFRRSLRCAIALVVRQV